MQRVEFVVTDEERRDVERESERQCDLDRTYVAFSRTDIEPNSRYQTDEKHDKPDRRKKHIGHRIANYGKAVGADRGKRIGVHRDRNVDRDKDAKHRRLNKKTEEVTPPERRLGIEGYGRKMPNVQCRRLYDVVHIHS